MFDLPDHYVWDFWTADDGELFHLFFLKAPRSLGDPELRHVNARIGHAVSTDLSQWSVAADPVAPLGDGYDSRSMWTGAVARVPGGWRMLHSGLSRAEDHEVQRAGSESSTDLLTWRRDAVLIEADPQWYDVPPAPQPTHWRDPFPIQDDSGTWHLYLTAKASGVGRGRGTVGHATSADCLDWTVGPPLAPTPHRFEQAEVISLAEVDGRWVLIFSCLGPEIEGAAANDGGVWSVPVDGPGQPVDLRRAVRLADECVYVGRVVQDRTGRWQFLAFRNRGPDGAFLGGVIDPVPVRWRQDGTGLELAHPPVAWCRHTLSAGGAEH